MTSFTGYWLTRGRPHCLARRLSSSFSLLAGTAGPRYRRCVRAKLIAGSWEPVAPGKSRTRADLHRRQLAATSKPAVPVRCRSTVPRRRIEGWCSSTCRSGPRTQAYTSLGKQGHSKRDEARLLFRAACPVASLNAARAAATSGQSQPAQDRADVRVRSASEATGTPRGPLPRRVAAVPRRRSGRPCRPGCSR